MDSHVAPLALPTNMGTTREIDLLENTQFRGRNGIAQAYLLKLESQAERDEWLKHSVVFLERHSDHHAQLFFDPMAPQYYAKTWSSLNYDLANAAYSTYPTASAVLQRWRYMGVVDNVQPLHGLMTHQGPACQAQINVVIGQYVRTFNYWLSALDPEALQANQTGLHCWGVVKLDRVADAVRTRPRIHRPLRDDVTDQAGSDSDGYDSRTSQSLTPVSQGSLSSRYEPIDENKSGVSSAVMGMGPPKDDQFYTIHAVPPLNSDYRQGCYSGHQLVIGSELEVRSNTYTVAKSGKAADVYMDLEPVTPAQRDVAMALQHGWVPPNIEFHFLKDFEKRVEATTEVEDWFTTNHFRSSPNCPYCTEAKTMLGSLSLDTIRERASVRLMETYTDRFFRSIGNKRPQSGETWFLFDGFGIQTTQQASGPVTVVWSENATVPKACAKQATAWVSLIQGHSQTFCEPEPRQTPEGAYVLPAVLLPFWVSRTKKPELNEFQLQGQINLLRLEAIKLKKQQDIFPDTPSALTQDLDHLQNVVTVYQNVPSDPSSATSAELQQWKVSSSLGGSPSVAGSSSIQSMDTSVLEQQVKAKRQRDALYQEVHRDVPLLEPDWYHQGYRWQIVPVVTATPVPPCKGDDLMEPIYMGRCVFVMGSVEREPGLCKRFVQPADPRATVAKLASRLSQLDLVVCSHPS